VKRKNLLILSVILLGFSNIIGYGGNVPSGLPSTFGFGAIDKADQYASYGPHFWKDNQGTTCWDYSYQYLTPGWTGWVSGGGWAKQELQYWEGKGQIQVFTWYYTPYQRSNYQNSSWMTNYFNDFKLLMQIINQYSTKKVIVHIEPDLLGFWKQEGKTPTQNGVVAVGSSNFDEVCDGVNINNLPDTIQGWSEALYRIKNQYASSKCLLAHHFTHWATGADIFKDSQDQATVNSHVDNMTTFITQIENGKSYDLFFVDPSDRDADWYYIKQGDSSRWTSSEHTFTNYRSWGKIGYIVDRVSINLGRRGIMWQIPVGNTYFKTCNNSNNHFRDNHAQEFLPSASNNGSSGTPGDAYSLSDTSKGPGFWANKGIITVLFGEGGYDGYVNPNDMTHLRDWPNDGITNPSTNTNGAPGYNTWGQATSNYSDNDGGYIRLAVAKYCQVGKYSLPGAGGTATHTPTRTNTPKPTSTYTPTRTNTPVPTSTFTPTRTNTQQPTSTMTNTLQPTSTRTYTSTNTSTPTNTSTLIITFTRTNTSEQTSTRTYTNTPILTNTFTITLTRTSTFTATTSITGTSTATPTSTFTFTNTNIVTGTFTNTPIITNTSTPIATFTFTATLTLQITATYTNTQQITSTFTYTNTQIIINTFTFTPTATSTNTNIITFTQTHTFIPTQQDTFTPTQTLTPITPTNTPIIIGDDYILKFIDKVRVYPNPVNYGNDLKFQFKLSKKARIIRMKIYTTAFRFIYSLTKENINEKDEIIIKREVINKFSNGVYYYILSVEDEVGNKAKSESGKVIIAR